MEERAKGLALRGSNVTGGGEEAEKEGVAETQKDTRKA